VCNGKSQEGEPLLLAFLETVRDVAAGEELTFDYKPSAKPWKGPGKLTGLLDCKCGAHNCRWVM
jgi:SET domain-containing protein